MKTLFLLLLAILLLAPSLHGAGKLRALIVDGQNNHEVWPKSTIMMKQYLEQCGLFEVEVARTGFLWRGEDYAEFLPLAGAGEAEFKDQPTADPSFAPDFANYDLVVSNFGWKAALWPARTRVAFEEFVAGGGGFVAVHAADNSFPLWAEYNRMIGVGGWGDRTEKDGPYVYVNPLGEVVRDTGEGKAGKHAKANAFLVTNRDSDHPVTKGLPPTWRHGTDECYSYLRGPAENFTILATASDSPELQAAGRNEPMLMAIDYGKGRVFHTTLGHAEEALECVGFITTFLRGAQWAASGIVTQEIPQDFPGTEEPSLRTFSLEPAGK